MRVRIYHQPESPCKREEVYESQEYQREATPQARSTYDASRSPSPESTRSQYHYASSLPERTRDPSLSLRSSPSHGSRAGSASPQRREFTKEHHELLFKEDAGLHYAALQLLDYLDYNPDQIGRYKYTLANEERHHEGWAEESILKCALGIFAHKEVRSKEGFTIGGEAFQKKCTKKFGKVFTSKEIYIQYTIALGRHIDRYRRQEAGHSATAEQAREWYCNRHGPIPGLVGGPQVHHSAKDITDANEAFVMNRFYTHVESGKFFPNAVDLHHEWSHVGGRMSKS